ncbi:hypothetical protein [Hyphococcus luteus]|uniref:Uncharacterized protein n=1 Tax=Hyphococcus luteus TaxID=2058213 RepID=A0A2S7K9E7_9PROT|nr:hypothetical protein [Marinicaulis flavus]PQA89144.1 hypothetical protein CW354_04145 [Marinicaulis flavus]
MADDGKSVELYRMEGDPFRSVCARLKQDEFTIDTQDMGELVKKIYDDGDYEFWTNVPKEAWGDLLFALAQEFFTGEANATDRLRDICEKHGVKHKRGHWA